MGYPETPLIPTNSTFTYENVDDLITTPDMSELARTLDPEYMDMIDSLVPIINPYSIPSVGNLNQPTPTRATLTYDPLKQQTPPDYSTEEGKRRGIQDLFNNIDKASKDTSVFDQKDPVKSNIAATNFERYYYHPNFKKLGWQPYRDNESYYNANSTFTDDLGRMWGQLQNLTTTGFVSAYRSWGDMFDNDAYFTGKDLDSAREFSDAMRIGNSTRDGVGHFVNNLLLQSGYTIGIIGSIAAEELALAAGTALTGGGFAPVAAVKTGANVEKVVRATGNLFGIKKAWNGSKAMLQAFNNVDKSRAFYHTLKATPGALVKGLKHVVAPETMYAWKRLGTTKNVTQNLSNFLKSSSTYGAFYRDIRGLNYALSESKMEGGMVYDQVMANGYAIKSSENNGGALTDEQMKAVVEGANNAAYYTTLTNAPIIYATNQLTLGNAFGAYRRSLSRLIGDGIKGLPKGIAKGKTFIKGKAAKDVFVNVGDGFKGYLKRIKTVGFGKAGVSASLRYFSANVGEGIQELAQEAIAHGTEHYWQAIIKDPAAQNYDVWKTSISSAMGSQFSAQGFETFMSGFLMGGIVQGPQKILFQGIPGLKNHIFNREQTASYKKRRKATIDGLVDTFNKQWNRGVYNDLNLLIDPSKVNLVAQKNASDNKKQDALNQSQYDFMDAELDSRFQNAVTIIDNGSMHLFEEQMQDYLKLTNEELAEAFPSFKDDIENGKLKSKIQKQLTFLKQLKKSDTSLKDLYPSPVDLSQFKEGTKEHLDAVLEDMAWKHARNLALFTRTDFKNTLERMDSIFETLQNDPVFEGMEAKDITVVLSKKGLAKELLFLKQEIDLLDDSAENAEQKKNKTIKYTELSKISDILYGEKNQKDGEFDSTKIDKFYSGFRLYIKKLAGINQFQKKVFEDESAIQEVLIKVIDHIKLGERADAYARSIEFLNNPESFKEIADRQAVYFKELHKNLKKHFEDNVKDSIKNDEINQFLNALAQQGVYVDPEQLEVFIKTGDVNAITKYYSEDGKVTEGNFIIEVFKRSYTEATKPEALKVETEAGEDEGDFVETTKDTSDLLDEYNLEQSPPIKIYNTTNIESPFIARLLRQHHDAYATAAVNSGQVPLTFESWVKGDDAKAFIEAYVNIKNLYWNWLKDVKKLEGSVLTINFERDLLFDTFLKASLKETNLHALLNKSNVTYDEFILGMKKPGAQSAGTRMKKEAEKGGVDDFDEQGGDGSTMDVDGFDTPGSNLDIDGIDLPEGTKSPKKTVETKGESKTEKFEGNEFILESFWIIAGGKKVKKWRIYNIDGSPLTPKQLIQYKLKTGGIFKSENAAKTRFNVLEHGGKTQPIGKEFTFAGEIFTKGNFVYQDKGGKVVTFLVLSSKQFMGGKDAKLYLIPLILYKKNKGKEPQEMVNLKGVRKLTPKNYKDGKYYRKAKNITKEKSNIAKLRLDEPIDIYAVDFKKERLELIVSLLTPEERANIKIKITKNKDGGKRTGKFYGKKLENGSIDPKTENRKIPRVVEPFSVEVVIDNAALKRINKILGGEALKNGTIGFIPTGSYMLLNQADVRIDINKITDEEVKAIFNKPNADQIDRIKDNFAKQSLLVKAIEVKLGKSNSITTTLAELGGFSLDIAGSPAYSKKESSTKERIKLTELDHSTVDGNVVILRNLTGTDGSIISSWVTDIAYDFYAEEALIKKIEEEMPPFMLESAKSNQGYIAIIKLPNGKYSFAPLKTESLDKNALDALAKRFIDRAVLTINENLTEEGVLLSDYKVKDPAFNNVHNVEERQGYFITTTPGYYVNLYVDSDGRIAIKVWDKNAESLDGKRKPNIIAEIVTGTRQMILDISKDEDLLGGLIKAVNENLDDYFKSSAGKKRLKSKEIKKFTITKENFRKSLPAEGTTVEEIIAKTDTDITPKLYKNLRYQLNANPTDVSTERNIEIIASNLFKEEVEEEEKVETPAEEALKTDAQKEKEAIAERLKELNELITSRKGALRKQKKKSAEIARDSELIQLIAEKDALVLKQITNKIVAKNYSKKDIEDLDTFIAWANQNLPSFITVRDINQLKDNLMTNGVRVGAFALMLNGISKGLDIDGTIYTGANNPMKYHEAFHGVFRMLLTDEQIDKYLRIAKKELRAKLRSEGKSYEKEKEKFKNSAEKYKELSERGLDDLFVEEHMADQFDKFKMNPKSTKTDAGIKNMFTRFLEWVFSFFKRFNKNELLTLYENIDSGKFKSSNTLDNRFTNSLFQGTAMVANAILPYNVIHDAEGVPTGYETLDVLTATTIVDQIAGRVIMKEQASTDAIFSLESIFDENDNMVEEGALDGSLEAYADLYDPDTYNYDVLANKHGEARAHKLYVELENIHKILTDPEYVKHLKKAVMQKLALVDISEQYIKDKNEALEESKGVRSAEKWDINKELIGGHSSLPAFVRKYFATVTLQGEDKFGNKYLTEPTYDTEGNIIEGEPIIVPVNAAEAYNGFLKATKNTTDPFEVMRKLVVFSENNSQTAAIVNKLLKDIGLTRADALTLSPTSSVTIKNSLLFQRIIKAFENFRVPYMFFHLDTESKIVYGYSASQRDDASSQIDRWGQAYRLTSEKLDLKYNEHSKTRREYIGDILNKWSRAIGNPTHMFTDQQLNGLAKEIAVELNEILGISLSPTYVAYTIIATKNVVTTPYQSTLKFTNRDAYSVSVEDLTAMRQIIANKDKTKAYLFSTLAKGMDTRLKKIAMGNAEFDESVGASTFLNAEGELVYGHQLPTYHLRKLMGLNDPEGVKKNKVDNLKDSDPYLELNHLLNSPAFKQLSYEGKLAIVRVAGIKAGRFNEDVEGADDITAGKDPGTNYGDLTPQDFALMMINSYTSAINMGSGKVDTITYKDENGVEKTSALAPVLIRVLEAASTGDMTFLPVIKAVEKGDANKNKITDEVVDAFINNIKSEFHRIQRESNPETATYNKDTGEGKLKVGYNAKADDSNWENTMTEEISYDENGRAFKLHKSGTLLDATETEEQKLDLTLTTNESVYNRVKDGTEKILLYKTESKIGLVDEGVERTAGLSISNNKKSTPIAIKVKYNGRVKIDKKDTVEQLKWINKFDTALSTNSQEGKHRVYFKQKNQAAITYYTNDIKIANFLNGKKEMGVYEIIDLEGTIQKQKLEESAVSLKETLETLAKNNTEKSFEDIVNSATDMSMTILKEYIREKLRVDFKNFNTDLSNFGLINEISSLITQNVRLRSGVVNEKTMTSASLLNLKAGDIEYNLMQIFLNDYVNTTSINQILLGDHAIGLKNAIDEIKRAKHQNAAFISAASVVNDPSLGVNNAVRNYDLLALTETFAKSAITGKQIEVADGQLYMTVKAFRHTWFGIGQLTTAQAKLLDKIENGEAITIDDVLGGLNSKGYAKKGEMVNSKKFVFADGKTFIKMSGIVLTKQLTSKEKIGDGGVTWVAKRNRVALHNLREKMEAYEEENDTIMLAAPRSALKMMQVNVNNINDMVQIDPNLQSISKNMTHTVGAENFGLQLVNPSNKQVITDPTQIKAIITSEQNDATTIIIDGKEHTLGAIRKAYHATIGKRLTMNYKDKRNLVYNFSLETAMDELHKSIKYQNITPDLYTFLRYATESLLATNSSSNLLEFFAKNLDGSQKYNLNNPITIRKFEQLFLSYFSKGVLQEKVPGDTLTMLSDFGIRIYRRVYSVDKNGLPDKQEVIRENIFHEKHVDSDIALHIDEVDGTPANKLGSDDNLSTLAVLVEQSKGKGVIIVDRLRHNMKSYKTEGAPEKWVYLNERHTEGVAPALNKDVFNYIENNNLEYTSDQWEGMFREYAIEEGIFGSNLANVNKARRAFAKEFGAKTRKDGSGNVIFLSGMTSMPDMVSKMFAVRIPSQDKHSALNVRMVDFLPVFYGSTGVFSRELIEISGADFDIDKLFVQMKEYFFKQGKFQEYGKAANEKEKYEHYMHYINKKVKKRGTVLGEALFKYTGEENDGGNAIPKQINLHGRVVEWRLTDNQIYKLMEGGLSEDAINALSILGLPRSFEEYKQYKKDNPLMVEHKDKNGKKVLENKAEPYSAPLNNRLIDYKTALLGNDYMTGELQVYVDENGQESTTKTTGSKKVKGKKTKPIAYESADIVPLTDLWEEFVDMLPEWAKKRLEGNLDVDNMYGKVKAYGNNQEGDRNIGAAVLPSVYLALLGELGISVTEVEARGEDIGSIIEIDGIKYAKFGEQYEKKKNKKLGNRTQYIMSALITAMTDNAKERMAAKLGLNRNALAVVANMTSLGVPLETSLLIVNNKFIQHAYFLKSRKAVNFKKLITDRIGELQSAIKEHGSENKLTSKVNLTTKMLENSINSSLSPKEGKAGITAKLQKELLTIDDLLAEIAILNTYLKAKAIADFTANVGVLLGNMKGLGSSMEKIMRKDTAIEKLGLDLTEGKYQSLKDQFVVDVRPVFLTDKTFHGAYFKVYQEITKVLFPKTFTQSTELFKTVLNTVEANLKGLQPDQKLSISYDLLSYLTIKAYETDRLNNNAQSIASLSNDLIYPVANATSIISIVENLRRKDAYKDNFFLKNFIVLEESDAEGNVTGLNLAVANTFNRLNDVQKVALQDGFAELWYNAVTRSDAMAIVHYAMVKDGLMYRYGGLTDAIVPIALEGYLKQAGVTLTELLNNNDSSFKQIFSISKDDLINEFLDGYLTSASFTKKGLLKSSDKIGQYGNPEDIRRNMLVSFLEDVKSQSKLHSDVTYITSARTAAKDKKKWVTAKNTSKLKNVFLLSFRKPNAKDGTKQYYSNTAKDRVEFLTKIKKELNAIKKAFGLTEAQKIKEANKKIFLDKYIISNEDLDYYKANVDSRQASIIDDLMKIFEDEFGINVLMRESFNDPSLKGRRVHIDGTEGKRVLKVNPYLYTNLEKSEDNKTLNPPKQQADALSKMILDMGYKGFKSVITEKGKFKFTEFLFPKIYQVRLKVGVKRKGLYYNDKYEYVLFKLKKVYSADPATSVVSETNEIIRGSYAEYEVVLNNGSYAQWPGGFMFGERASNEETRPKPQEKLYGIDGVDIEDSHFDLEGIDAQQGQGSAEENIDDFDDQFDPSDFDPMPLNKGELLEDVDQPEIKMNTASVTNEIIGDDRGEEYNKLKDWVDAHIEVEALNQLIAMNWVTKKEYDDFGNLTDLLMSKYDEDPMTTMDELIETLNKCIIPF